MLPAQPIQGLIDGISCLQSVISSPEALGSREVGRRCDLNRTRANRILGTWRHLGLLSQNDDAKYLPGPGLHILAGMGLQASGLLRASLTSAEQWWTRGYSVSLAVRWQDQISFLIQAQSDLPFIQGVGRQVSASALRSSAGLAMLAHATDQELAHWNCSEQWEEQGDGRLFTDVISNVREHSFSTRSFPNDVRSIGISLDQDGCAALAISNNYIAASDIPQIASELHKSAAEIHAALADQQNAPLEDLSIPA